jgi:hypothetical protein
MKKCFGCKTIKPLSNYSINKRAYQVKAEKGRCIMCSECCIKRASKTMSAIKHNAETNKFETVEFETMDELNKYYKL